MEYSVQRLSASSFEFRFDVNKEEWDGFIKDAYVKTKGQYQIQGFRKGHVPMNILERMYGKAVFYEDAADLAVQKYWQEAVAKEENLELIDNPLLDIREMSEDGLKFVVTATVKPEFELGKYTGLTVEKSEWKVDDKDVDYEIESILKKHSRKIEVDDRAAKMGDNVNIDFSGSVNGEKFEGGTAKKFDLKLGGGRFIPGFEEQVEGMKIGEERDITVTFPEDYGEKKLAGKEAVFHIKLHTISFEEIPELDDEFVKDVSEKDTVAEYKAEIKADLEAKAKARAESAENDALITEIVNGTNIDIPDVMIREETDKMIEDLKYRIEQQTGVRFADYLKYVGTTEQALREERKEAAKVQAKARLIMDAIIKKEGFEASEEDVEKKFGQIAEEVGKSVEEYKKIVGEAVIPYIENEVKSDKMIAFLRENNKFAAKKKTEKSAKAEKAEGEGEAAKPAKKPVAKKKTAAKPAE